MNDKYKIIPFAEVAVGQEFEDSRYNVKFNDNSWTKLSDNEMKFKGSSTVFDDGITHFKGGCLVLIADCAPPKHCWEGGTKATCDCPDCGPCLVDYTETPEERKAADCVPLLDFDTWWGNQCEFDKLPIMTRQDAVNVKELCRMTWDAARATNTAPAE